MMLNLVNIGQKVHADCRRDAEYNRRYLYPMFNAYEAQEKVSAH